MTFDAFVYLPIFFKKGRSFFIRNHEEVYDLTQIPTIPEEFRDFETLRGFGYMALLLSTQGMKSYSGDDRELTEIPIYTIVPDYDTMKSSPYYNDDDITHAEFSEFKRFCDWVRETGVEYNYYMTY